MTKIKVSGKINKHKVLVYTLSTCIWCKKIKKFLQDLDVEYEYIDVDLSDDKEREKIRRFVFSYPLTIIDEKILIDGYKEDKILKVLEL
jgi:glutaredoxin